MFNYTNEVIINDPAIIVAGTSLNGLGEGVVAIKRGGNYVINNINLYISYGVGMGVSFILTVTLINYLIKRLISQTSSLMNHIE